MSTIAWNIGYCYNCITAETKMTFVKPNARFLIELESVIQV
jgi:hypothetical protein